ncbi:fumarate reductase subunit FrdC [Erwinia billingiae]|uniref:fumarate reductase subunit FrdC n=1 Tax=Erwinia billingiae TaxID=182337 RepID=UPI003207FD2D
MTTKRKPFLRPMTANWWQKSGYYRFYMLREATALPALWFSLEMIFGLFALKNGEQSWQAFVAVLQHPLMLLINIVALAAALLHSKTWFELAPKAQVIVLGGKKMSPAPVIKGLWLAMVVVSLILLTWALLIKESL